MDFLLNRWSAINPGVAGLSPTDFESFCFDLLSETGFVNVDWRKGTPKGSSPADRGRDIVAELERTDVDGPRYTETWFVDCKHYERGVPPEALQGTVAWAQAERPAVALYIASGYFTNGAKDWMSQYERNTRPPFRIRTWEMPQLRRLRGEHMDIAFRHDVHTETLRRVSDILAVESELTDRLWYGRGLADDDPKWDELRPEIAAAAKAAMRQVEDEIGVARLKGDVASAADRGFSPGSIISEEFPVIVSTVTGPGDSYPERCQLSAGSSATSGTCWTAERAPTLGGTSAGDMLRRLGIHARER